MEDRDLLYKPAVRVNISIRGPLGQRAIIIQSVPLPASFAGEVYISSLALLHLGSSEQSPGLGFLTASNGHPRRRRKPS